jgi:hypothetical protein
MNKRPIETRHTSIWIKHFGLSAPFLG